MDISQKLNEQKFKEELALLITSTARDIVREDVEYKERFYDLVGELRAIISEAEGAHSIFEELGLSFSSVESEGYLRCAKDIERLLKDLDGD